MLIDLCCFFSPQLAHLIISQCEHLKKGKYSNPKTEWFSPTVYNKRIKQ